MNRFKSIFIIVAGLVLVVVICMTMISRRVQAQGSSDGLLVHDLFQLPSNLVELNCTGHSDDPETPCYAKSPDGRLDSTPYQVPRNMNLVITSVESDPLGPGGIQLDIQMTLRSGRFFPGILTRARWRFPNTTTTVYQYPSGMVLAPGFQPFILQPGALSDVTLRGYLCAVPVLVPGPGPGPAR